MKNQGLEVEIQYSWQLFLWLHFPSSNIPQSTKFELTLTTFVHNQVVSCLYKKIKWYEMPIRIAKLFHFSKISLISNFGNQNGSFGDHFLTKRAKTHLIFAIGCFCCYFIRYGFIDKSRQLSLEMRSRRLLDQ